MKLNILWLSEWVPFSLSAQQLAEQLTMAGLEVDALSPVAGEFTQVVVAKVLSTKPHPNADKLTICEVDANEDAPLQVVCGAANVRPGLKVALAKIGARLPGDFKIKESTLRGIASSGMLCSLSELGLADQSEGIMELDEDAPIGMNLREYLSLDDQILEIDLTPNRADCFSLLGIAREVSALNQLTIVEPPITEATPTIDDVLSLRIHNDEACPRYCGRIIRGIQTNARTPLWMRERLRRCGIRSIHPIVDIMNYVMLELGQPMHAFDLAKIEGGINVRFSQGSESIRLLDEQVISLNDKTLVIADAKKTLAIAGIMGGADSAVSEETEDLFLESAFFNPITVAGIARKHGLFSDSSQRFERGVDPYLQRKALERATALIISIAGGEAGPVVEACSQNALPPSISVFFDPSKVEKICGLHLTTERMQQLLNGLGMTLIPKHKGYEVKIPSHRFDIQLEVDLVEEIVRLYGYDKLEAQLTHSLVQTGKTSPTEKMTMQLASWFKSRAYHETISYSFVEPQLQESLFPEKECMQLLNPISSDLSQMRCSLWPGLIASMLYNFHRQQQVMKLFETGVVFDVDQKFLKERACIAGLLMGEKGASNWSESSRHFDFYDLKGDLQSLLSSLQLHSIEWLSASHPALHPGQSAQIIIDGLPAGWIGALHPRITDALDIPYDVLIFELSIADLIRSRHKTYKKISKYPQIRRDLSFLVDESVSAFQIESLVRASIKENWLKRFDVFDVYKGVGVPEGKKSLAIAMILQDENRTLVDSEINLLISAIIKSLETKFSIILRD